LNINEYILSEEHTIDCKDCREQDLGIFTTHWFPGTQNNPLYEQFWAIDFHTEKVSGDCYGGDQCSYHVNCDPETEEEDAKQRLLAGEISEDILWSYIKEYNSTLTYNQSRRAI